MINKQQGWSTESNLLYDILKATTKLSATISNIPGVKSIDNLEILNNGMLRLSYTDSADNPLFVETSTNSLLDIKYNVQNYNALLVVTGQELYNFAYVRESQGTPWLPGSLGGTYYGAGLYMWNGVAWVEDKTEIYQGLNNIIANKLDTLTSPNNSVTIGGSGSSRTLVVTQASEAQLGGGIIATQAIVENSATTNDTDIVTAKKFWQGWNIGLTLLAFFNAVRGTVLTGLSFVSSRITASDSILSGFGKLQGQTSELQATRFISGTGVSINVDNTKFDIQAVGVIVDPITFVETPISVNLTAQTTTYLAMQPESYVWINSSNTVVQSLTPPQPIDLDYIVGYWVLVHSNLTNINVINHFPHYADGLAIKLDQLMSFIGFRKFKDTNIVSRGTTGTRISHTGGFAIKAGIGNTTKRPVLNLNGATDSTFRMRNRLPNTEGSDTQTLDVTNIDVAGVTTELGNNRFGAHKVWKFSSSLVRIQRGQYEYANIDSAKTGIKIDNYVNEGNADRNGIHIGWIIFKKGTSWGTGGTGVDGVDYLFVDEVQSASAGTSAVTMQGTYDNSTQPQLLINDTKGAIQNKTARASAASHIEEWLDSSGNVLHWIAGDGTHSFGNTNTSEIWEIVPSAAVSLNVLNEWKSASTGFNNENLLGSNSACGTGSTPAFPFGAVTPMAIIPDGYIVGEIWVNLINKVDNTSSSNIEFYVERAESNGNIQTNTSSNNIIISQDTLSTTSGSGNSIKRFEKLNINSHGLPSLTYSFLMFSCRELVTTNDFRIGLAIKYIKP